MRWVAPIAIGGLAAALGLYDLGADELGGDEATSFFIARLNWEDTWTSLSTSEANGSPFYLMLHFWTNLGDSEFILRILPLLFAIATPVVLYFLMTRLFGRAFGIGAAVLLSVNAFFVFHSQNLRSYSLSAFLATLATYLFVRMLSEDKTPRWATPLYVVTSALLLYAHFFGVWVLIVHVLSLLFINRSRIPFRSLAISYLSIAVLAIPIALFVLFQDVGQVDWIQELSTRKLYADFSQLTGFGGYPLMIPFGLLVLAASVLAINRFRTDRGSTETWATWLVVMWFVVPVAGGLAISLVKPLWESRYLLIALPGLSALVTVFLGSLRRPIYGVIGFVAMVGLSVAQLPGMYTYFYEPTWASRAEVVLKEGRAEDGLIFYSPTTIRAFGYHYGFYRDDIAHPEIIYPNKYWLGFSRTRFNPPITSIVEKAQEHDRVWMMLGAAKVEERKVEQLEIIAGLRETCENVDKEFREFGYLLFEGCNRTI